MSINYSFGREEFYTFEEGIKKEWLLTNGIGGFANQSIIGANHRIQCGYLIASFQPPVDRYLILSNTNEVLRVGERTYDLTSQGYIGEQREGFRHLTRFELNVVPTYRYEVEDVRVSKSIAMEYGENCVAICYECQGGMEDSVISITPLFNYRLFCDVIDKNKLSFTTLYKKLDQGGVLQLIPEENEKIQITFYASQGDFDDRSQWPTSMANPQHTLEENQFYQLDRETGFLGVDHHYTPYDVVVKIPRKEKITFYLICQADEKYQSDSFTYGVDKDLKHKISAQCINNNAVSEKDMGSVQDINKNPIEENHKESVQSINNKTISEINIESVQNNYNNLINNIDMASVQDITKKNGFQIKKKSIARMYQLMEESSETDSFIQKLTWAADAFLVDRKSTKLTTILAGYPWFTDWGRDTMIAFTGLTLCTKRFDKAREILQSFSYYVKDGMIPNVFPNKSGEEPGYNTIDASLWYFYAVHKYLEYDNGADGELFVKEQIYEALQAIIHAYEKGTHYGIHMDIDGLITGGSDLDQLTWMDVRVGNIVVTPRHGKAVEINALWYNALCVMENLAHGYGDTQGDYYAQLAEKVKSSFVDKFWNEELGCLYDVVDTVLRADQACKDKDASIRPNQIYAVSLPYTMLEEEQEKSIVDVVHKHLYTTYGLRSLSYADPRYKSKYIGKLMNRDLAYHMGTTWAYLMGAYITAYRKVHHYDESSKEEVTLIFEYFKDHMKGGCINGIAEIFDGDVPSYSRGCYSQAWSVGEILRAYYEELV